MIEQFGIYQYSSHFVIVLTNTIFNDVDSILIAPIKKSQSVILIKNLQIPCRIEDNDYFVDLLDIATVSKHSLKPYRNLSLKANRDNIKSGIDLLIDGF